MKKTYKILAAIGAFFGMLLLIFRKSSSADVTNVKLDENQKKLDDLVVAVTGVEKEKKTTKKKINKTKDDIKKTKSNKKSTTSAKKKAKSFKDKYKKK
jgi:septal ring factor EnvC (AmiA/AmiB activator)